MNKEARRLLFIWLRCVNHTQRVAAYLPPREDLLRSSLGREQRAWAALSNYREALTFASPKV